jgi:hypothetical protein
MPAVTHYKNPSVGHHACGMGGQNPTVTSDIGEVTCKRCLTTVTGKKALVRTTKRFSASQDLIDWLESQPNQNQTIREALEKYRAEQQKSG